MTLFLQVSSSLAPMQYTGVCRIAQMPKRGWLLGFGREVFFPRHRCSVEKTEGLMFLLLFGYIYLYILLLGYITIGLYIYIGIVLFVYCFIACSMGVLLSLYLYFIFVPYYDLYFL